MDDSKLVFQANLVNAYGQDMEDGDGKNIEGPVLQANGQLTSAPKKVVPIDGSADVCGICE